jgi:hypothetical protein
MSHACRAMQLVDGDTVRRRASRLSHIGEPCEFTCIVVDEWFVGDGRQV